MNSNLSKNLNELENVFKQTHLSDHVGCRKIFQSLKEQAKANPIEKDDIREWMNQMIRKYHKVEPVEWVCNVGFYELIEHIWRRCYQIVVWEECKVDENFPNGFGCGFVLKIDDYYYFVTADHVINAKDHDEGVRINKNIVCGILNNESDKAAWQTKLTSLNGFYYADMFDFNSVVDENPDTTETYRHEMVDITFCNIDPKKVSQCLTHQLSVQNKEWVKSGLKKTYIDISQCAEADNTHKYMVLGTFKSKLKNGMIWDRVNAFCFNLVYTGVENRQFVFKEPEDSGIDDWHGLSGSPVFSDIGKFIGMLVRHSPDERELRVIPAKTIINFIRMMKGCELKSPSAK